MYVLSARNLVRRPLYQNVRIVQPFVKTRVAGTAAPRPRIHTAAEGTLRHRVALKSREKSRNVWRLFSVGQTDERLDTGGLISSETLAGNSLSGEDAAQFSYSGQKTSSWIKFTLVLGIVLGVLYFIWLDPDTGYGGAFIDATAAFSGNLEVTKSASYVSASSSRLSQRLPAQVRVPR